MRQDDVLRRLAEVAAATGIEHPGHDLR
jgi:hypothetical protein